MESETSSPAGIYAGVAVGVLAVIGVVVAVVILVRRRRRRQDAQPHGKG